MGWGTEFTPDIYLSRYVFKSTWELDEKIKELSDGIQMYKDRLKQYISANPKDIIPNDWKEEPIEWLDMKASEIFDGMDELQNDLFRLEMFKRHLEETNKPIEDFNPFRNE